MFGFKTTLKTALISGLLAIAPLSAQALTLTIDDLSTGGVDQTVVGLTNATFSGAAGGFSVSVAAGNINSLSNSHTLNTTSIQTQGIGTLQIMTEQTGLTGFPAPFLSLTGSGSVTDIGLSVVVEHLIDLGGGYQTIGNVLNFAGGTPGPVFLSDITSQVVAGVASFDLRTVITVVTGAADQTANVNATLVAAVPIPAAGLMLLTALGGLGLARRRRRKLA